MSDLNQVTISGNLTHDPEVRYTPGGTAVLNIQLASNNGYGEKAKTNFVPVTLWGKTAENAGRYLRRGAPLLVSGSLETEEWESKGEKKSRQYVKANFAKFYPHNGGGKQATPRPQEKAPAPPQEDFQNEEAYGDDDIPF